MYIRCLAPAFMYLECMNIEMEDFSRNLDMFNIYPLILIKSIIYLGDINLQVGDIDGDVHLAKRIRRSSSDALQDMVNGDELSLYGSGPNNAESTQVCHFLIRALVFRISLHALYKCMYCFSYTLLVCAENFLIYCARFSDKCWPSERFFVWFTN